MAAVALTLTRGRLLNSLSRLLFNNSVPRLLLSMVFQSGSIPGLSTGAHAWALP